MTTAELARQIADAMLLRQLCPEGVCSVAGASFDLDLDRLVTRYGWALDREREGVAIAMQRLQPRYTALVRAALPELEARP